jgi:hypothetical protein
MTHHNSEKVDLFFPLQGVPTIHIEWDPMMT